MNHTKHIDIVFEIYKHVKKLIKKKFGFVKIL